MDSPELIRYADDLVALCHSRQEAIEIKARLAAWLAPRGLAFNEDKTRVVTLDEGFDFLGIQRPPLRQQAADQTEQGGRQTDPETARHRAAVSARDQRPGGDQTPQPDHPGMGGLLPDAGVQRDVRRAGSLPMEAHLQVGHGQPPEQAEVLGLRPVLRQVQQGPARPMGVRRPQQRRLPPPLRLDHASSDTRSSTAERPPTTPRSPSTGPGDDAKRPCRSTRPARGSSTPRTVAARSAAATLIAVENRPQNPREWEHWLATTRQAIHTVVDAGTRHAGRG